MENPATWGPLEKCIDAAIRRNQQARERKVIGLSLVRTIADSVRDLEHGVVELTHEEARLIEERRKVGR